jgi:hypothetical protein
VDVNLILKKRFSGRSPTNQPSSKRGNRKSALVNTLQKVRERDFRWFLAIGFVLRFETDEISLEIGADIHNGSHVATT